MRGNFRTPEIENIFFGDYLMYNGGTLFTCYSNDILYDTKQLSRIILFLLFFTLLIFQYYKRVMQCRVLWIGLVGPNLPDC